MISPIPILPIPIVEQLYDEQLDPVFLPPEIDHHVCLVHLMQCSDKYASYYAELHQKGEHVTLDPNGKSVEDTLAVFRDYPVTEIILPSYPGDKHFTIETGVDLWDALSPKPKPVIVPQGSTLDEWFDCMCDLIALIPFPTIGVVSRRGLDRDNTLAPLAQYLGDEEVHLLGMSKNNLPATETNIRSIHSATAVAATVELGEWKPWTRYDPPILTNEVDADLLSENIARWANFIREYYLKGALAV